MRDKNNNPMNEGETASLIHAGADGELSATDQARLEAMIAADPEIATRVEFERELRKSCSRAMGEGSIGGCPDALRSKIEAMAAGAQEDEPESHVERVATVTWGRSFWAGERSRGLMAVAAMLLLSASAVLVWQSVGLSQPTNPQNGEVITASYRKQLAEFVTKEHERTGASEAAAERKFVYTDAESAQAWFAGVLGDRVTLPALSQPVETMTFMGAGKCGVPGSAYGESGHMRFEVNGADGTPIVVSVFAAPRSDKILMVKGKTYVIDMPACGIEGYVVLAWTDGIANYFLVAEDGTNGCGETLKAIGRPEPSEKI